MGVQLRIIGAACRLTERGDGQSMAVGVQSSAVGPNTSGRPEPLDIVHDCLDGDIRTLGETGVAGQRPPH